MASLNYLKINDFRCHTELDLRVGEADWVVLAGGNGAGKTSILEAIYAIGRGGSFRARAMSELIRLAAAEARVLADVEGECGHRLGAAFGKQSRELHLDGSLVQSLVDLSSAIPVEYLDGTTHHLVNSTPSRRRRFVDWGLFHVEPHFLSVWRAWHKAHRQRNELLRQGDYAAAEAWIPTVADYGEQLSRMRGGLVERIAAFLRTAPGTGLREGRLEILFTPGWREGTLADALRDSARRERRMGRAVIGPQYDDWVLCCGGLRAGQLSRGQAKLAGFFLLRALVEIMQEAGRTAVLLVDDFLADFDQESSGRAVAALGAVGGQKWIAVREEAYSIKLPGSVRRFHVEPGRAY